jgi:hypothetical protein
MRWGVVKKRGIEWWGKRERERERLPAVVDGFGGVLDLEDAAIGRECGH